MGRPIRKVYFNGDGSSSIGGEGVASIAVGGTNNAYVELPALSIAAPGLPGGVNAVARAHMAVVGITNFSAGTSGYAPGQVLTLAGGTGTQGTLTVVSTKALSAALGNNSGTGYAGGDVVTVDGGTGTSATVTVVSTQVKTVAIAAGGDGYATGDTIELTTGTTSSLAAQFTVGTIVGGAATGPIETITVVPSVLGTYTVNPTLTGSPTNARSGGGTNATLDLTMEAKAVSLATAGSYTANPTLTNAATTPVAPATGTGLTVSLVMIIDASPTITTGGDYTALPADVSIVGHTGGGTGALFNLTYKVLSAEVTTAGSGYAATPVLTETPDGNATFTLTMTAAGANVIAPTANVTGAGGKLGDVVKQASSRGYIVTTADGTGRCTLVAAAPGEGQVNIFAKDSAGGLYYVTKLTARRATIVKGDQTGAQFTTGADGISVPWVFSPSTAVENVSVEIVSN